MPFQPGQSGNPGGGVKEKLWRKSLDRAIAQDDGVRLRAAAEKLLDLAAGGEMWACRELGDRLDGKAAQQLIHSGDSENPVVINATVHDEAL